MSRGIYLSILICVFFLAIAFPALAITTGPDNGDVTCEEDVLAYPSKLNLDLTAHFRDKYEDPVFGKALEAAHYQFGQSLDGTFGGDEVNFSFLAVQMSFEKDYEYEDFLLMKAQDRRMPLVAHFKRQTFPQYFDSVRTDADLTVASPNFDRLFLNEVVSDADQKPNVDALKRVVSRINLQVHPELRKRGVKQTVIVSIDSKSWPMLRQESFIYVRTDGSFTINERLVAGMQKLTEQWNKDDVRARFVIKGHLDLEPNKGQLVYVPAPMESRPTDTPKQYWHVETRTFPKQIAVHTGPGKTFLVHLAPNPTRN